MYGRSKLKNEYGSEYRVTYQLPVNYPWETEYRIEYMLLDDPTKDTILLDIEVALSRSQYFDSWDMDFFYEYLVVAVPQGINVSAELLKEMLK